MAGNKQIASKKLLGMAVYVLNTYGEMTAMKLQKILYYCQAWSLFSRDRSVFPDQIQAWAAGPVIPSLYEIHKGKCNITSTDLSKGEYLISVSTKNIVDTVYSHYGKYSGSQLSDLTHTETAWKNARSGLLANERGEVVITESDIKNQFI